jgi:hypothetical protein
MVVVWADWKLLSAWIWIENPREVGRRQRPGGAWVVAAGCR